MDEFKVGPQHLIPVLFAIIFATVFAAVLATIKNALPAQVPPPVITPFSETGTGPIFNAIIFVAIVAIAGTIMYLLIKRQIFKTLKIFIGVAYAIITFVIANVYISIIMSWFINMDFLIVISTLTWSIALTFFVIYLMFFRRGRLQTYTTLVIGSALGAFLGFIVPTLTAFAILIALALYDIIAVYKGPVGKIVSDETVRKISGLSFTYEDIEMGLGDIVFYSMLVGHVFLFFSLLSFFAASAGVILGSLTALKILEKRTMVPGLPFALFIGILLALLAYAFLPHI
jgi:presenilin-like A22 family membrane protease